MKKTILNIEGMHCPSCSILIKDVLDEEAGIKESEVIEGSAVIRFDESKISLNQIKELIKKEGYKIK